MAAIFTFLLSSIDRLTSWGRPSMSSSVSVYGDFMITTFCYTAARGHVVRVTISKDPVGHGSDIELPMQEPDPVYASTDEANAAGIARGKAAIDAKIPGLSSLRRRK
jgi:hypothetical protein